MCYLRNGLAALCLMVMVFASAQATPVLLTELNDGDNVAKSVFLWGDGSTVLLRNVPEWGHNGIFEAQWSYPHGTLSNVRLLTELNQGRSFAKPNLSSDGLRLYYREDAANGESYIRVAQRASLGDPWSLGQVFTAIHQPSSGDTQPTITGNELTLYWSKFTDSTTIQKIWKATQSSVDDQFSNPVAVTELNSLPWSGGPHILPDGKTIYYNANGDIYRATRSSTSDPFSNITYLTDVNTTAYPEWNPYSTADQKYIYFYSEREAGKGIWMIPEPMTLSLLALGCGCIIRRRRV